MQHLYPTATIQPHLANGRLPQQEKFSVKFQFLEQIRLKTLQLFVPNSKRLGGYTQWVHFFLSKKTHVTKKTFSRQNYFKDSRQKEAGLSYTQALLDKEPGNMLGDLSTKIMHVQKQLRLIENNSYIMSLSSGARPSFQLLPEARNQRQRTKNTRNSRLQRRQHIKTLHPISFLKKRTRRRLGAAGYIAPEFFWRQESGPSNFCKQKQEARGLHSVSAIFTKIAPPKKNPDISSEAACRETTRMMV